MIRVHWNAPRFGAKNPIDFLPNSQMTRQQESISRPSNFYFNRPIHEVRSNLNKLTKLATKVRQFRHDPGLIVENGISGEIGLRDAYSHLAPMIDTETYMKWLFGQVERAGCRILQSKITGSLREHDQALTRQFGVTAIVNCTGLGLAISPEIPSVPCGVR